LFGRDSLASHASGFALGALLPSLDNSRGDAYAAISNYSVGLHRDLAGQLSGGSGVDAGDLNFVRKASVSLVTDETEAESLRRTYEAYADDYSVDIRWLELGEPSHIDMRISENVFGGLYVGEAYELDPHRLTLSLWQTAGQQGAQLVNRNVTEISVNGDRVSGVVAGGQVFEADAVVAAAGPWSSQMLAGVGVNVPVTPLKGQIIRLDAPGPPIKISLWWGENYATTKPDGLLWAGTTEEETGFDDGTTDEARDSIIGSVVEMLPYLEDAVLVQQAACLRPMTPDRSPIIDADPGPEGLVVVTGAGRNGIMQGPAMGQAATALATGVQSPIDVSAFSLARFS
jgi:glycine/D-amino acid oxidase-like deaminating enzyme